jgi:hypothetical protein
MTDRDDMRDADFGADDEPELRGYEASDRPLRSKAFTTTMRVVVFVGLVALVLPGLIYTYTVQKATAERSCAIWVNYEVAGPSGSEARLELFGPGGVGWECYSVGAFGPDGHIASLGLIPGPPRLPAAPLVNS